MVDSCFSLFSFLFSLQHMHALCPLDRSHVASYSIVTSYKLLSPNWRVFNFSTLACYLLWSVIAAYTLSVYISVICAVVVMLRRWTQYPLLLLRLLLCTSSDGLADLCNRYRVIDNVFSHRVFNRIKIYSLFEIAIAYRPNPQRLVPAHINRKSRQKQY